MWDTVGGVTVRWATVGAIAAGVLLVASSVASAEPLRTSKFRMPSGNIGCAYAPPFEGRAAALRCDILSGLVPEPTRACPVDWTGLGINGRRRGHAVCAGDTVYEGSAPKLRYGRQWRKGPFRCTSRTTGLTCRNTAEHGFHLARENWRVF
jgi:hypothetical protein